jgi:methylated-DNA-[protein]-cysteine S-methyltransferase
MKTDTYYSELPSPLGPITLRASSRGLSGIFLENGRHAPPRPADWLPDHDTLADARTQLAEYFAGARTSFDLALDLSSGTPFQQRVWTALLTIPHGETVSYGEIARRIGQPKAVRAVGLANGRNPICIVVPCHRVIGANGALTGYGGGLDRKQALLTLEQH